MYNPNQTHDLNVLNKTGQIPFVQADLSANYLSHSSDTETWYINTLVLYQVKKLGLVATHNRHGTNIRTSEK